MKMGEVLLFAFFFLQSIGEQREVVISKIWVAPSVREPSEIEEEYTPDEVQRLWTALKDGEQCVKEAWLRRRTMNERTKAMHAKVIDVVRSIITKEKASMELYRHCFPNDLIVDRYVAVRRRQKKDVGRGRGAQSNGVEQASTVAPEASRSDPQD